jgi:translation initiation factor IF-1
MATKEEKIEVEGEVTEALPSTMFRVKLGAATTSSRRSPGRCASTTSASSPAKVKVELSPYDLNRGRITYRHRS